MEGSGNRVFGATENKNGHHRGDPVWSGDQVLHNQGIVAGSPDYIWVFSLVSRPICHVISGRPDIKWRMGLDTRLGLTGGYSSPEVSRICVDEQNGR